MDACVLCNERERFADRYLCFDCYVKARHPPWWREVHWGKVIACLILIAFVLYVYRGAFFEQYQRNLPEDCCGYNR